MAGSSSSGGDDDYTVMETDSTGHYTRYSKLIDEGDHKEVYLGYDNNNGREVAWCKKFLKDNNLVTLVREAKLLKKFDHQNIIKCYHYWVGGETIVEFNMITELYSGNLKNYTQKHQVKENSPAIKNWCQQILTGLDFLHSQNEPIIHDDIKCGNIFVVGNSGTIKLGDLSVAKILAPMSSPQYKADYIRRMEWSEMYCVGLCTLQMVNKDAADSTSRIMDMSLLKKVQDRGLRSFIEACMFPDVGTTITDLQKDLFLAPPSGSTSVASAWPWPASAAEGDIVNSNTAAAFNVVERDSTNRYLRFSKPISPGVMTKTTQAYYGFDINKGNIVAWVTQRSFHLDYLIQNANLLKKCDNEYLLKVRDFWVSDDTLVLITDLFSGSMIEYIDKLGSDEANLMLKKWGRQILKGFGYLNFLEPRIVVTKLNCNSLLFDGVSGCVKLSNLYEAVTFPSPLDDNSSYELALNDQTHTFGTCLLHMSTGLGNSDVSDHVLSTSHELILQCIGTESHKPDIDLEPPCFYKEICYYFSNTNHSEEMTEAISRDFQLSNDRTIFLQQILERMLKERQKDPFLAPRTAPSGSTSVPSSWPWPTIQLQPAVITSAAAESEGAIDNSNTSAASEHA